MTTLDRHRQSVLEEGKCASNSTNGTLKNKGWERKKKKPKKHIAGMEDKKPE